MKNIINGYVIVQCLNRPKGSRGQTGDGTWYYEHIIIAEKKLGRALRDNEIVHHLDFNRSNNNPNNLLILEEGQHNLLHSWLEKGAPIGQLKVSLKKEVKLIVKGIVKISDAKRCQECKEIFSAYGKFCSSRCSQKSQRTNIPKKELKLLLKNGTPWTKIGKLYGISDNGARKIAKRLGIDIEKYKKKRT